MEYTFIFDTDNYDDVETFVDMIETIAHLLTAVHPNMIDLGADLKKQLVNQRNKVSRPRTNDKNIIMRLFDECVRKYSNYNTLQELCEDNPKIGVKGYETIWSSIGDALGPFAYTIHELHMTPWMYELIDIYGENWDWS